MAQKASKLGYCNAPIREDVFRRLEKLKSTYHARGWTTGSGWTEFLEKLEARSKKYGSTDKTEAEDTA
jgi:hypothetical protein